MSFFKLSVRLKIYLIALIGTLGFLTYLMLNVGGGTETSRQLVELEQKQLPALLSINNASLSMLEVKSFLSSAISSSEKSFIDDANKQSDNIITELNSLIERQDKFSDLAKGLRDNYLKYWSLAESLALGMIDGTIDYDKLTDLSKNMNTSFETVNVGIGDLRQQIIKEFTGTVIQINTNNTNILHIGYAVGLSMIVLLLLVTYFISNNITTSILNVASSLNDMASSKADLTRRIKAEGDDEVGLLVMAFNNFVAVMERLIGKTVLVSGEVTSQAESIHVIAIETHKGIVTQQQEIDLVAAAVAELSASSSEVATNASSTTALTKNATEETTKSHSITKENREAISSLVEEVARAAEVINHLQEKTNEIGSVIDVIRGIADQTNLLALNAAIEAARAGEQGRGFAVVADEVRSLANNTQVSTGEIEVLIRALQADSLEAVNVMKNGSKQALASVEQSKLVEQALDSISHFSAEINERSIQMLTASEEQMQVSEKLSQSINHINDVAIKTVDKANETIQSSKQLHRVADELGESVTQFLVGESSGN